MAMLIDFISIPKDSTHDDITKAINDHINKNCVYHFSKADYIIIMHPLTFQSFMKKTSMCYQIPFIKEPHKKYSVINKSDLKYFGFEIGYSPIIDKRCLLIMCSDFVPILENFCKHAYENGECDGITTNLNKKIFNREFQYKEILKLAIMNPILHNSIQLWRCDETTFEECLEHALIEAIKQNNRLREDIYNLMEDGGKNK